MKRIAIALALTILGCGQGSEAGRPRPLPSSNSTVINTNDVPLEATNSKKLDVKVEETDLFIDGTKIDLPAKQDSLVELLGKPSRVVLKKKNTILVWDDLGVIAYQNTKTSVVHGVNIALGAKDYDFWPKKMFVGTLTLDGATVSSEVSVEELNRKKKGKRLTKFFTLEFVYFIMYDAVAVGVETATDGKPDPKGEIVEFNIESYRPMK